MFWRTCHPRRLVSSPNVIKGRLYLDITLARVGPHCVDESPRHCAYTLISIRIQSRASRCIATCRNALHARIGRSLIISAATEHPNILALTAPVLHEILIGETVFISRRLWVCNFVEKRCSPPDQRLHIVNLLYGESTLQQARRLPGERNPLFHVVDHVHSAVGVGAE